MLGLAEVSVNTSSIITTATGIAAVAAVIGIVLKVIVVLNRLIRRTHEFLDDWNGEPIRTDGTTRKGVMERLAIIETQQVKTDNRLSHVESTLTDIVRMNG